MYSRPLRIAGTNAERTKAHNRRVVLGHLQGHENAGRAEIAKASGLSTQTVSNLVAELEAEGLVQSIGRRRIARGQPPMVYTFNPSGAAALGFEVRPDALSMVLTDLGGTVLIALQQPLENARPDIVFALMARLAAEATREAGSPRILGAGLVIPGPFGVEGLSAAGATVLPGWDEETVVPRAEAALGLRVLLEKDAIAAAISEGMCGVGQGLSSYAFLYFGAGLGLGVISDGHPLYGAFGNAGEVGHVVMHPGGLQCDCGNRGCLEQYASRLSVQRHLISRGLLQEGARGTDALLTALLAEGDTLLANWADSAAEALSRAIGLLENLFDPQTVILGGALPDALLDDLIARLKLPLGSVARRQGRSLPRVLRGASGRMTAAIGGAALVIHDAVTPRLSAHAPEQT